MLELKLIHVSKRGHLKLGHEWVDLKTYPCYFYRATQIWICDITDDTLKIFCTEKADLIEFPLYIIL